MEEVLNKLNEALVGLSLDEAVEWLTRNPTHYGPFRVRGVHAGGPRTCSQWPPTVAMCDVKNGKITKVVRLGD